MKANRNLRQPKIRREAWGVFFESDGTLSINRAAPCQLFVFDSRRAAERDAADFNAFNRDRGLKERCFVAMVTITPKKRP